MTQGYLKINAFPQTDISIRISEFRQYLYLNEIFIQC